MMMYQFELQDADGNMEYKRLIGRSSLWKFKGEEKQMSLENH